MNTMPVAKPDSMHLRMLQDDNRLLFEQLQMVQEELERLHGLPGSSAKRIQSTTIHVAPVDERFVQIAADNLRCQLLLETQRELHELQTRWALAGQLGEILIEGTRSSGSLLSVPNRLHKTWRQSRRIAPPADWGGKSFDKIIRTYNEGGEDQVRALLKRTPVANAVKASAWTALARTLIAADPARAAMMAGWAFALEPRGFRQKWLAFRLHEAGDVAKAEAWLTLLPADVTFTDSERRQKERLLAQAQHYREAQVRQMHDVDAQQKKLSKQWEELARSRDSLAVLVANKDIQIDELKNQVQGLHQAKTAQAEVVSQLRRERQALEQELVLVSQERVKALEKISEQQEQLGALDDELTTCQRTLREQQSLVAESQREHEVLVQTLSAVEHSLGSEKQQVAQWLDQCRVLQSALAELTQEKGQLQTQVLQQSELLESLRLEVATLQSALNERVELAEQDQKLIETLKSQVEDLTVSNKEQRAVVAQKVADFETMRTALESLQGLYEEQKQVAAQRQGELLQQSRDQLNLEMAKEALSLKNIELEKKLAVQIEREAGLIRSLSKQVQALASREVVSPQMLQELFETRAEEVVRGQQQLEVAIQKNTTNVIRQIQSFVGMQEYFATGVLPAFNSEAHSWPVSADFALCVMQRVVLEQYDLVIEFGSGMSTVVLAKTLALRAERDSSLKTHFVSFDHLEPYYQQTLGYLKQSGVEEFVQLILAPLHDWPAADGQVYPYYSCQEALAQIVKQGTKAIKRILVVVDGPPAATGPHARYPAGPIVMQYFPNAQVDFLMDDYIRQDEKDVAKQWQRDVKAAGLLSAVRSYKFEKDACLITVHPKDSK